MRRLAVSATALLAAWVLRFGDPKTHGEGWKDLETFPTSKACEAERQTRAREVREKAVTDPTLEKVLTYYRCEKEK